MPVRDASTILTGVVRDNARSLGPIVVVCAALLVAASGPLGIRPPMWAWVVEWVIVGATAAMSALHVLRRWPDRYVQLTVHAQVWLTALMIDVALYTTQQAVYGAPMIVLIASGGALLQRKLTLATIAGMAVVATVLTLRTDDRFAGLYVVALWFASIGAVVIHVLMSNALVRAGQSHDAAADAALELAQRVDELQRAQEERARLHEQLLHAQRMEAVGTLAAGVAHDMNNVLAAISSLAALTLAERDDESARDDLERIIAQTERGATLTRGLLAFSRRGQYRRRAIGLWELVRQLIPILERTLPKSIEIRAELPAESVCVEGDPVHLEQALVNIAVNARDAMDGTGTLWIRGDIAASGRARLHVTDTGAGMDETTRQRIFEPFFTTKALGKGTGLGLSTVWGIVQAHDGTITVDSKPGRGTTFTIELPVSEAAPSMRPSHARLTTEERRAGLHGTVMLVDDEEGVRTTSKRLLQRMGLEVITAEHGADALDKLTPDVRLVVLDMGMPVMGGAECFRRLRERSDVAVVIATGYATDEEAQSIVAQGASLLEKPFTSAQLRHEVTRLLAHAASRDADPHQQAFDDRRRSHLVQ